MVEALFAQPRSAATLNRLTRREREDWRTGNRLQQPYDRAKNGVVPAGGGEAHQFDLRQTRADPDQFVDRRVKAVLMFLDDGGSQ